MLRDTRRRKHQRYTKSIIINNIIKYMEKGQPYKYVQRVSSSPQKPEGDPTTTNKTKILNFFFIKGEIKFRENKI